ncbi:armadillo-type protein [Suillus clintonianus]|uniref:armadillo-type protein n=1 Tax=Suillus clintonianus TaxID=1904413 RepID=UPI001B885ED7|nr:armadillo-type protein [Suillus clintonianus]KAG2117729.1 armadillo-type protein [Suillus clintonianus]
MQSLLRWGVENSSPGDPPPRPINNLDPGIIDHILGKPDAQLMKEALKIGVDETQAEDDRLQALDDLEMLVQNIDNANDLKKLGMWEPLHGLLTASSTTDALKMQTLWIIGTALQNNPAAQLAYLELEPLPALIRSLSPSYNSAETRSRAVYALSGLLKLNAAAVQQMSVVGGWSALRASLEDSEIRVRRKTAFLLNALLLPNSDDKVNLQSNMSLPSSANAPVHANSHASMLSDPSSVSTYGITLSAIQNEQTEEGSSLLDALVSALIEPVPFGPDGEKDKDEEFQENVIRILYTFVACCNGSFSAAQKHSLQGFLGETTMTESDNFGLTSGELQELSDAVRGS